MAFGLGYLKDLYLYLTGRHEESHKDQMDRAGVPSQLELDGYSRILSERRLREEYEFGRPVHSMQSWLELAFESRASYYNCQKLLKELRVR